MAGSEQQQQNFFADKLSPYHEVVDLLLAQNKRAEAFVYAESARARVLLDVLRSGRVNLKVGFHVSPALFCRLDLKNPPTAEAVKN